MTDLLKAIGKNVAQSIKNNPESPECMKMQLFMYNEVDRRTKPYKDWLYGKISLSEAYTKAGGK